MVSCRACISPFASPGCDSSYTIFSPGQFAVDQGEDGLAVPVGVIVDREITGQVPDDPFRSASLGLFGTGKGGQDRKQCGCITFVGMPGVVRTRAPSYTCTTTGYSLVRKA